MKRCILVMVVIFVLGVSSVHATHLPVIWGAYLKYVDSDTIIVTAGSGRCNNNVWEISSEITVELSAVLPAGEDFLYIYIDDANSIYPTPTIVASTTEPAWSDSKIGWYSGNDRCIGTVWCDSSGNVIDFKNNSNLEFMGTSSIVKTILENGNPNSSYQTVEATNYIPVNAVGVFVQAVNSDTNSTVRVIVSSYESTIGYLIADSYNGPVNVAGWISLERNASRDLKWYGFDNDDSNFKINIGGFRIER